MTKPKPSYLYDIHEVQSYMNFWYPEFEKFNLLELMSDDNMYNGSVADLEPLADFSASEDEFIARLEYGNYAGLVESDWPLFNSFCKTLIHEFGKKAKLHWWW